MLTDLFLNKETLLTSLFFMMGIFVIFQILFSGVRKILSMKNIQIDEFTLRTFLGIIYIVVLLFLMQSTVTSKENSWIFINFQLVAVIFYTVVLSVPFKYHLFTPIVLAFMIFNSAFTSWESWCMAIILISFYNSLNYIKNHTKERFPYLTYVLTSFIFGTSYWFFVKIKFSLSNLIFTREIIYLAIFTLFTFGYIAILFTDVESRTALFRDATHDKLTAAFNYDAFDIDLRSLFKKKNNSQQTFTMMMFDIDHFKNINDTYGHLAGDKVLQSVVDIAQTVIENNDPKIKLYRTGGEEFNVIFPNYQLSESKNTVKEIFQAVNHSNIKISHDTVYLTVSMGVSEINKTDVSTNDFYSRVDKALYQSKRNGRREITFG